MKSNPYLPLVASIVGGIVMSVILEFIFRLRIVRKKKLGIKSFILKRSEFIANYILKNDVEQDDLDIEEITIDRNKPAHA